MACHSRTGGIRSLAHASILVFGLVTGPLAGAADQVTVFAAASMKNALDNAVQAWEEQSGKSATVSYAGSSTLAKQLAAGAPADIYVSANVDWMDYLQKRGLIATSTRSDLLANQIVLVAPRGSDASIAIEPGFDLAGALGDGRLAMANTEAVPAGIYGKSALMSLNVWTSVADKVAQAADVRAALALVSSGEAPFGIVYKTDAVADDDVRVVGRFPEGLHAPILYPIAMMKASASDEAKALLAFLKSAKAAGYYEEQGFTVLDE